MAVPRSLKLYLLFYGRKRRHDDIYGAFNAPFFSVNAEVVAVGTPGWMKLS